MIFDGPDGGQLMSMDVRDPWRRVSVGTSGQSGESFSVQHPQCEKKTGCGNDKLHFHVILTDIYWFDWFLNDTGIKQLQYNACSFLPWRCMNYSNFFHRLLWKMKAKYGHEIYYTSIGSFYITRYMIGSRKSRARAIKHHVSLSSSYFSSYLALPIFIPNSVWRIPRMSIRCN